MGDEEEDPENGHEDEWEESAEWAGMPRELARELAAMKWSGLQAIAPPKGPLRPFATILRGKRPTLRALYRLHVWFEVLRAMQKNEPVRWDRLNPVAFVREYAPAIEGLRAKQVVEITRSVIPKPPRSRFGLAVRERQE